MPPCCWGLGGIEGDVGVGNALIRWFIRSHLSHKRSICSRLTVISSGDLSPPGLEPLDYIEETVAGVSSVAVEWVGVNVRVEFGGRSNCS